MGDGGEDSGQTRLIESDQGIRPTTLEVLSQLREAVPGLMHTAGNSSQVTDGASAVILASQEGCDRLGLKPRARVAAATLVGVDPVKMLEGPIPATRKVLEKTGLAIEDMDDADCKFEEDNAKECLTDLVEASCEDYYEGDATEDCGNNELFDC